MEHIIMAVIRSKWAVAAGLMLCHIGVISATPPQVTNMLAAQRSGTKLVDITYTLTSDTPACVVSVQVSTNNGVTYDVSATNFNGNGYGDGVTSGTGKQIAWNAGADWYGQYSTQAWFKVTAVEWNTNPLTFTENTNVYFDIAGQGTIWGQPVYDGTNIVASCEFGLDIVVQKYDLNLNPIGSYAIVASTNDYTAGENISDHKHIFQNNYHYIVFSISDAGSLWLVQFDRNFNRIGIVQVVTNEPPTNDMLLFGDGESVYVGKFYPEGQAQAAHKIYKYDGNLNWITNYLEGTNEGTNQNFHANGDAAMYLDGYFYFVSPQHVEPGANDRYYRIAYDTNFNVVHSKSVILQDDDKLGLITGLSYYNGRFIIHYSKGSNAANPIARAVFDASGWNLIQNETVFDGEYHLPHTVVVSNALYLGYFQQTPTIRSKLAKFTMSETTSLAMVATGLGYVGPITVDTRGLSLVSADFDGDRKADPALYAEYTGMWYVKLSASGYGLVTFSFGGTGYSTCPHDYDGEGKTDPAVYEAASGQWQVQLSASGYAIATMENFGGSRCLAVAADYDGDGKADPAIYNTASGDWQVTMSSMGYGVASATGFGGTGYMAVQENYDTDNRADAAVYNTTNGNWTVLLSAQNYITGTLWGFGGAGYTPVLGDFDGDGLADLAIYQESTGNWSVKLSGSQYATATLTGFGGTGYQVSAADFDGDHKADPTLFETATGMWTVKLSASGYATVSLASGYTP